MDNKRINALKLYQRLFGMIQNNQTKTLSPPGPSPP